MLALIGCGVTTGVGAALNTARVEPGSTVAVLGCGGVGLSVVQGARIAGAGRIIAVDPVETKLGLARELGATDVVDASGGDVVERVLGLTEGRGVDYAFEAVGMKRTTEQSFEMLDDGATAYVLGMVPEGTKIEISADSYLRRERRIQGCTMGSNHFRVDMPALHRLLPGRPSEAGRNGLTTNEAGADQRRLRRHEAGPCGPNGADVRVGWGGPDISPNRHGLRLER